MNEKFNSFLYKNEKPFYKMSLRELCDYNKIVTLLDKMSLKKIKRIENWSQEKRDRKYKKFLNKTNDTRKKIKKRKPKRKTRKLKLNKKYFSLVLNE